METFPPCPGCAAPLDAARHCGGCGETWLTAADVARCMRVTAPRVQYLADTNRLPSVPVPVVRWFAKSKVKEYTDAHPKRHPVSQAS